MEEHPGRERRGVDRPIKRLRQLLARLDVLRTESQALRNTNALDRLTWPALAQADELVSVIDRYWRGDHGRARMARLDICSPPASTGGALGCCTPTRRFT